MVWAGGVGGRGKVSRVVVVVVVVMMVEGRLLMGDCDRSID